MHWNARDLQRRLARALEVAERAIAFLGDAGWRAGEADGVRPEKVLSETALFLLATRDACERTPELAGLHRSIAVALVPFGRNERSAALIALEPVVALDHALMHLCLSRMGMADTRFDRLLATALSSQGAAGRERLPHRAMEQQWLLRMTNASPARLARTRDCILDHPLDAIAPTPDDLYAFTHCLLFGTDLGLRAARFGRSGAALATDAETALARCLDIQDFDVAGELLMTWPMLQRRWSNGASFGFLCLAHAEDEAGFLPAPGMSLQPLASLSGIDRTRHLLATSYHTIYVMGLLCALALRTGVTPRSSLSPSTRRVLPRPREVLDPAPGDSRVWCKVFDGLPTAAQEALTPFLLTVQIQRAAARRDFAGIQRLLGVAAGFDLLGIPAARQGLELLQRAAMLGAMAVATDSDSTAIGARAPGQSLHRRSIPSIEPTVIARP
ncbi:DUF6895 family protein [Lysobacter sp. P5_B9]